jgi:hypothetical protein
LFIYVLQMTINKVIWSNDYVESTERYIERRCISLFRIISHFPAGTPYRHEI